MSELNKPIPIQEFLKDFNEEEKKKFFENLHNSACSLCGCKGLHACMGKPVIWTEDDKKRFHKALDGFFNK